MHVYPVLPLIPEARRAFRQTVVPARDGSRSLTFDDLDGRTAYDVWRLRQHVFVVEQASAYPDLDGRDLEPDDPAPAADRGRRRLVGYLRLLDDGDAARIGRVVVAPSARGRGLADELMRAALAETGDRPVRLDAQTGLAGWYASYGFEVSGPEFDDDGILHLPMTRPAGQRLRAHVDPSACAEGPRRARPAARGGPASPAWRARR